MITKDQLKSFYYLDRAISDTEDNIYNPKYIDWWFIMFDDIRDKFWEAYYLFDDDREYPILDRLVSMMDDWYHHDTDLLTEEDRKRFTKKYTQGWMVINKDWVETYKEAEEYEWIMMDAEFYKACAYTKIEFNSVDEAIDYIFIKMKYEEV